MYKKGFTLVELMVVITVIAILATIAVASFTRVQKQARDTKRKAEMKGMQTALQAYFTEKTAYPIQATAAIASTALASLTPTYMAAVPTAPKGFSGTPNVDYTYISDTDGYRYAICAGLEAPTTAGTMWKVSTANSGGLEVTNATCVAE